MTATLVDIGSQDRQADKDADFSAYMSARQPALYRTAYLLAGDHASAEDLLQTAFATALPVLGPHPRPRGPRRLRPTGHGQREQLAVAAGMEAPRDTTDTMPDTGAVDTYDDGMGGALWSYVQTLPPKQRSVVVLRYYEQLSEAEIADVLGISSGTVKSQASRALAALRARAPHALNPHESGDGSVTSPTSPRGRGARRPAPQGRPVQHAPLTVTDVRTHARRIQRRRAWWPASRSPPCSRSPSLSAPAWSGRPRGATSRPPPSRPHPDHRDRPHRPAHRPRRRRASPCHSSTSTTRA